MPKTVVCLEGKGIELVPMVRTVDKGHDLASVKPWAVGMFQIYFSENP